MAILCQSTTAFHFYSTEGFALARKILLVALPNFEPHHYQMDGVCKVLAGIDLIACTPTGSGKTGYLFLAILVMIAIARDPSLCPGIKFPKNPAIIVVCPTNSIEQQMDKNMADMGITALTINADTVAASRQKKEDIWLTAHEDVSMLILGPEQLTSRGFRDLLTHESFYDRVCAFGVDEIHLLLLWGMVFRKAFLQIGFMRSRLRPGIPLIGLTTSLLADLLIQNSIYSLLGVNRGDFYLIHQSNARHDIQILFRRLYSGIDGGSFPELAWVLKNNDKTLIFGGTIRRAFQIKTYLNSVDSANPDRDIRIRMHTGLNWADDKLTTLDKIVNNPKCQIIVATNGLAQGNDIKVINTVIQLGEPETMEMYIQKPGRARPTVENPRGIFYVSASRMDLARTIVAQTDAENDADAAKPQGGKAAPRMSRSVAEILTTPCKPAEQDRQFDNPIQDSPCFCQTCISSPPTPRPEHCICSGCCPEADGPEVYLPAPKKKATPSDIPQGQKLTKVLKQIGVEHLEEFRLSVWFEASDRHTGQTPLAEFLPDMIIKQLLDRFAKIQSVDDLSPFIQRLTVLTDYHQALFEVISELRLTFKDKKKADAAAKKAAKK
ncbi:P-loop containing nucleoside triphosphate hydrolase protein [Mycena rosella]|uniref:DNA 3'-5' helicase n=1 Tax=Mycena rosella TaxID=1033263 RepID=A0AAD7M8F4_MYCRO|nr:P-loop containing nucleoside triphosphate hydrolase protein [Mycena rosella]